ncbi:heterogeneous nuclear ribonucleoprotein K-like protein, partial [Euroglyphus maynei]
MPETKAGIKVYSECCPQSTERVCAITGPIDIVTNALGIILNLIRTFPIKGPNQLYNPANFDPFMSLRYGGYGETTPGQLPHGHPSQSVQSAPSHHHEPSRTNSIFTPPPIPPPPPAQYHHPAPPIHHPHPHHAHHHPFSSQSTPGNRHLSALTNGPPPSQTHPHHHLMDHRSPSDYGATSPSFLAAAA